MWTGEVRGKGEGETVARASVEGMGSVSGVTVRRAALPGAG